MKKLFIFLVMSIICLDVWSQTKLKTKCKFGFKLGSGIQTITGPPVKTKPRIAFIGGIWVQIKMNKSWTMQSELTYAEKGAGGYYQDQPKYNDYLLHLRYFEVPILFQYNTKKGYYEFGPTIGTLVKAGEYAQRGISYYQTDLYPFNNKDLSFNLGAGYVFNEKWLVGLRLTHSLLPIRKQLPEPSHPVYNRGILLTLSRQISFKAAGDKQSQVIE